LIASRQATSLVERSEYDNILQYKTKLTKMFLFGKKAKRTIQRAFMVVGILVIIGMIVLYFPIFSY